MLWTKSHELSVVPEPLSSRKLQYSHSLSVHEHPVMKDSLISNMQGGATTTSSLCLGKFVVSVILISLVTLLLLLLFFAYCTIVNLTQITFLFPPKMYILFFSGAILLLQQSITDNHTPTPFQNVMVRQTKNCEWAWY